MRMNYEQRTLGESAVFVGVGLHSGQRSALRVSPAPCGHGIRLMRHGEHPRGTALRAIWRHVVNTRLSTTLGSPDAAQFITVEHLLAALHGCGIDNALVEVSGSEIPIMDGSARPFVEGFEAAKRVTQPAPRWMMVVKRPLGVRLGERFVAVAPAEVRRFTVEIDFASAAIGRQRYSFCLESPGFSDVIAPARTFGFEQDLKRLQRQGLARGGSRRNAIVIDGDQVVNAEGLRFPDEFVRHKLLDLIGDVALAGVPVLGHFYGYRPGHELNTALLRGLMSQRDAWSLVRSDRLPAEGKGDQLSYLLTDPKSNHRTVADRLFHGVAAGVAGAAQLAAAPKRATT